MVNTKQTKITWNQIKKENNLESTNNYHYLRILIAKHNFKRIKLIGQIGNSGTKTHNFFCVAKFHPATPVKIYDGEDHRAYYEIATCFSYCGSKKWQSGLYILGSDEIVTCKKCNPKSKALKFTEGRLGS